MAKKITKQVKKPRDLDTGAWYLSAEPTDTLPQVRMALAWVKRYAAWIEYKQRCAQSKPKDGKK